MIPGRYQKSLLKLWRRLQKRVLGGNKVLLLGDSHCGIFEYCFDQGLLVPHWINCEIVAGATAYGLLNENSTTQAWAKFDCALKRFRDFDAVVIMLGECDCSYALWRKAENLGVAPEALIETSLSGIRKLVARIRDGSRGNQRILVAGAPLPTVDDSSAPIQDNELRREIGASQVRRTELVLTFNARLEMLARELRVGYFDLTVQTMNPATGLVDRRLVGRAGDHHLSHPASAPLWSAALRKAL